MGCDAATSRNQSKSAISIHAPRVGCDDQRSGLVEPLHNFNPRTPCGVRQTSMCTRPKWSNISIHAPRVGCDQDLLIDRCAGHQISIHAPRVGCDHWALVPGRRVMLFQSTHPVWGATSLQGRDGEHPPRISIHAPRVGCDNAPVHGGQLAGISIHAPRVGCDAVHGTPDIAEAISIHAPRVGCDGTSRTSSTLNRDFNPRTPCGVRPR